uniref:Uncharacterized protein n=1 Tax=Plectus sambesii TaxID=2011161 RepID=A0A914XFE8_9BILA
MSSTLFKSCCVFLTALALSEALSCYQCSGAESAPKAIKSIVAGVVSMSTANGTECNSDHVCSAGTFCLKTATIYSVTVSSKTFKFTKYTKACTAETSITYNGTNTSITSGSCYPSGNTIPLTNQISASIVQCYCSNGDKCNGVDARSASLISVVLSVIALLTFY